MRTLWWVWYPLRYFFYGPIFSPRTDAYVGACLIATAILLAATMDRVLSARCLNLPRKGVDKR